MLLVFTGLGCVAEKISVSPLPGVPAKPQFPLSLQLPVVPPPDQLKIAPSAGRASKPTPKARSAVQHAKAVPMPDGNGLVERERRLVVWFLVFMITSKGLIPVFVLDRSEE